MAVPLTAEGNHKGCGQNPNQDPDVQGDRKEIKPRHR